MKRDSLAIALTLVVLTALAGCNLPQGDVQATPTQAALAPTDTATPLPTVAPPSATAVPTNTIPAVTSTPSVPTVWPKDQPVNCRFGPDVGWVATSGLLLGASAEIVGKNAQNTWWYIKDPMNPGAFCWVAMAVTNAGGNLALVPVLQAPTASVTKVSVSAEVSFNACGEPNPIMFSGEITTNGPAEVQYRWEIRGDAENTTSAETLVFGAFGTKSVPDPGAYKADCGEYSVRLRVLAPNETSAVDEFTVEPP